MQDVHQGDTYMYLLDHLNKMSELLVYGLLVVPCGKWQVASVDKVLWCRFLFFLIIFYFIEKDPSYCPCVFPALLLEFGGSQVDLPPLVVTALTFSREFLGCRGFSLHY